MFRSIPLKPFMAAVALVAVVAGCGGNTASSTDSILTKNAAPPLVSDSTLVSTAAAVKLSCSQGGSCAVGDLGPGGGIVFYVAPTTFVANASCLSACKYLEAAQSEWYVKTKLANTAPWCGVDSALSATKPSIGAGRDNTLIISKVCAASPSAAQIAKSYVTNQTDWFLPSLEELGLLYSQRVVTGVSGKVWSSSEDSKNAWMIDFAGGAKVSAGRTNTYTIAPIRAFAATK